MSAVILADYPFAGLEPIQELSQRAGVSAPSISRFVSKLGYRGFQEFQQSLVRELREGRTSPIELKEAQGGAPPEPFAAQLARASALLAELAEQVPAAQFDRVVELLSDPRRRIYMIGGRMTDSIARFFVGHLRQIRADVVHFPSDPETWPEYLLRLRPRDVVLVIDFRRYQASLERLAAKVRERRAQTIVITDQWISPAARGATELIPVPTLSGTLWDSYVAAFALVEALLVPLAERNWSETRTRIEAWDALRDTETETPE
ncbi:transcriptional regulator, RpiR family protein [Oceanicola granulosus HTCC2516]|uniref:Transcriptional regulator, RpiR family protein n=1 Tax=Oceanicola granulosus (strain ATCC BAA-861 / DSM 15982 / KCTC 12143 / HTCC2516) TaxID=314256 RepID=Q2CEU6_OCEGH|nr:transcriptional regulator, RpiR family protein [Oceanicola granulosus HTCC2516]